MIVDAAIDTGAALAERHGLGPKEQLVGMDVKLVRGYTSYNRLLDDILVNPHADKGVSLELFASAAHEHGHRIADKVIAGFPGMLYMGQPGAMAEAVAETHSALAVASLGGATHEAAARRILETSGETLDMGWPVGVKAYPQHMREYVKTLNDSGGVHLNRSIPMKAMLSVVDEHGWGAASALFYDSLANGGVDRHVPFRQFRDATLRSAERLEDRVPGIAASVSDAWRSVGLLGEGDGSRM